MKNVLSRVGIPVLVVLIFFQVGSKPVFGLGSHARGLLTFWITWANSTKSRIARWSSV